MKSIISILFLFLALSSYSQSPQGIPYQAVLRNADGSVMASSAVNLTFKIHNGTANGTIVYQESHALISSTQGLVSCIVGNGTASQGTFASINWGNGPKFLHVMMGTTDMGAQQMLSVPYALYAGACDIQVSLTGDTLYTGGGNFVIIPGISEANAPSIPQSNSHSCGIDGVHNSALSYGSVLDQEGNAYKTILIGDKNWFAENLKTSKYRNGDVISSGLSNTEWSSTSVGAYSYYNDDESLNCPYGKLYNWYAVNDSRGLCPTGWHVPTNEEWVELRNTLGGDVLNVGGKLKSTGSVFWNSPNVGANNESGFSSMPGGARQNNGIYDWLGYSSNYWTSTLNGATAYFRNNVAINDDIYESFVEGDLHGGISVRCIQDSPITNIQGCTNPQACNYNASANVDNGSCLIQGNACNDDNANTTNDVINGNCVCAGTQTSGSGTGAQLLPGNATCATQNISVTSCGGQTSLTYDGRTYDLVEIGGQCWFADNLATDQYRNGDLIPTGLDNATWQSTTAGAYAIYNNDPANDATYGKLYNWYTTVDSRGLCPTGWHVPTDCEWMYLEGSLGMSVSEQEINGWRANVGGSMKATTGWNSPNTGATNSSGFTAIAGGYRFGNWPSYSNLGIVGYWWSNTEFASNSAWGRLIFYNNSVVNRFENVKKDGFSVRCVRD
jgi:uncharacterized protein (TIGR02145 family)